MQLLVSRRIRSSALLKSSECDGYAACKWRAASDTVPQAAPKIMTVCIRLAPLGCINADPDRTGLG
ncbi:hypothetical protein FOY95_08565 [Pseudomonas aeruginosa]|nr:hypothetical protein FOY95_08565 [Pseudomonas aeruginosa]